MGLVLWIDENTFATSLLEKVFKKKNLPFYTLSSAGDFLYLVEDLRPELIVLDSKTAENSLLAFTAQYTSSTILKSLPFILIDDNHKLPFIEQVLGEIKRPFDPFSVPQLLEKILKSH